MKCIAIIPARGGSKGIPRKCVKLLAGQPLISYIIRTAKRVQDIDRVIVSTEDDEIANVAISYGAEIPFVRPLELASDNVPTLPVVQHAVHYLEEDERYTPDIVVLLMPTSPLVSSERISEAISMLIDGSYDSVISVTEDTGHYWIKKERSYTRLYPKRIENRQLTEPLLKDNGAVCVVKYDMLMNKRTLVAGRIGFLKLHERAEALDIDEPVDFEMAECLLSRCAKC